MAHQEITAIETMAIIYFGLIMHNCEVANH